MRSLTIATLILVVSLPAVAQEFKVMESRYLMYSGSLGDPLHPKKGDPKISIEVVGEAAENIFNQIGPDIKDGCPSEPRSRLREKNDGAISCQFNVGEGYTCYLGLDLKKGKLLRGSIC